MRHTSVIGAPLYSLRLETHLTAGEMTGDSTSGSDVISLQQTPGPVLPEHHRVVSYTAASVDKLITPSKYSPEIHTLQ